MYLRTKIRQVSLCSTTMSQIRYTTDNIYLLQEGNKKEFQAIYTLVPTLKESKVETHESSLGKSPCLYKHIHNTQCRGSSVGGRLGQHPQDLGFNFLSISSPGPQTPREVWG